MIIEIEHLKKSYGEVKAVDDLSFKVREGEFFAFLGVNGAGKSTTINIINGTLKQDGGEVYVCGEDMSRRPERVQGQIGIVFQNSALDKRLSAYDNLKSRAALYGIFGAQFRERLAEITEMFALKDFLRRPLIKLSGGQRRRVDLARALFHRPKLLILDEPTTGLDPQTRAIVWNAVEDLRKREGLTVFLTTHYMEEAAAADYVVILDSGKKAAEGTPLELKNRYTGDFITLYHVREEDVKTLGLPYEKAGEAYRIEVKDTAAATELILRAPALFSDYEVVKGNMDAVFLNVTGKRLQEV